MSAIACSLSVLVYGFVAGGLLSDFVLLGLGSFALAVSLLAVVGWFGLLNVYVC